MSGRVIPLRPAALGGPRRPAVRAPESAAPGAPKSPQDAARFRAVMLPHLDAAYSLARYLARDAAAAEDIAQDAMLKAYRAFDGWRGGEAKAWLLAIVRNAYFDWRRRNRVWDAMGGEDETDAVADEDQPDPELAAIRQWEAKALRDAIEDLPEPFREALVLRELEDLSYRQVAEVTGAPVGTVMSRLARARQMLARALGASREAGR